MKRICILGAFLLIVSSIFAQNNTFKVLEPIDTLGFPALKATIQMLNKKVPTEADFKVLDEDKKELPFTLNKYQPAEEKGKSAQSRLIFFLVETSGFTAGTPLENIKKALVASLDFLEEGDKINIGYFGKADESGKALNVLSAEYTNNKNRMREAIRGKINATADSTMASDVYKGIYEAIDFISESREDVPKILIVLSTAVNNSQSPMNANDCIDRATRLNLPLYMVAYKTSNQYASDNFARIADKTNGMAANVKNSSEIKNALNDFIKSSIKKDDSAGNDKYILAFSTNQPADGKSHQFEVQYGAEKQVVTYESPSKMAVVGNNQFLANYGIIILIVVGVLLGFAIWRYNEIRIRKKEEAEAEAEAAEQVEQEKLRREAEEKAKIRAMEEQNIRLQEQLRAKESEMQRAMEVSQFFQKEIKEKEDEEEKRKNLRQTMIAGGASAPTLHVISGALNKQFPLNKPTLTIGRNPNSDIMIPEQTVSGFHATITIENGSFVLTDRNSTNGIFVNGTRIVKHLLKSGDVIKLGSANAKFEI